MKILFVIYAGLIPLVPLIGIEIFRKKRTSPECLSVSACSLRRLLYRLQASSHMSEFNRRRSSAAFCQIYRNLNFIFGKTAYCIRGASCLEALAGELEPGKAQGLCQIQAKSFLPPGRGTYMMLRLCSQMQQPIPQAYHRKTVCIRQEIILYLQQERLLPKGSSQHSNFCF